MSSAVHPTTDDAVQAQDEQVRLAQAQAQALKFYADSAISDVADENRGSIMKTVRTTFNLSRFRDTLKARAKRTKQRGYWVKTFPPDVGKDTFVCIERARGLPKRDVLGSSDPYCVVYWCFEEVHRTAVRRNDVNPEWTDEKPFELVWPTNLLGKKAAELHIAMLDHDAIGQDDELGEVRLTVDEICGAVMDGGRTLVKPLHRFQLSDRKGQKQNDVQGSLTFWVGDDISKYERSNVDYVGENAAKSRATGCCVVQ